MPHVRAETVADSVGESDNKESDPMKRNVLAAAAAAALLLGTGAAQAQMMTPAWYGELGYTFLKIDAASDSARPGAVRGILGVDLHPYFAVEGMAGGGVNDDQTNGVINGVPATVNVDFKTMYGLFGKAKYNWAGFELFGRLGWAHTKVAINSLTAGVPSSTQSDDDLAWGLGANYRFDKNLYVGGDWMRYSNQSGHKVDGFTLAVGYHW